MSSLTDLRSTLDRHADTVDDAEATVRLTAVRHRVADVRRRRRVAGAGALALVVLAGVATAVLPHGAGRVEPAAPVVLGQQAPATMTSLGYTYRTDGHGESFRRSGTVQVLKSDKPQLYSWTTDGATAVQVRLPGGDVMHSVETGFDDFVVVPPGESGKLTVLVDRGRVGLASYDLAEAAPGVTKHGVTFRQSVDDVPLLTAALTDEGQPELTASFVAPEGPVRLYVSCTGLANGQTIHLSMNGLDRTTEEPANCANSGFDPAASGFYQFRAGLPGTTVRVRAYVTPGVRSHGVLPASQVAGLRMGFGVYGPAQEASVGGWKLPRAQEAYGHLWQLMGVRGTSGAPVSVPAEPRDRLAYADWNVSSKFALIHFRAGSTRLGSEVTQIGQGGNPGLWVPANAPAHLRMSRGTGSLGLGFYERAD